jgi:hypothetical protein
MKKNLCFFLEETPLRNYRFLEDVLFSRALGIYKRADNLCATRPYFHIVYHMSARIPYLKTKKGAEKPAGYPAGSFTYTACTASAICFT